jgi:MFS family permease
MGIQDRSDIKGDIVTGTSATPLAGGTQRRGSAPRRAAIAAFFGSALEYYDFAIYGSAAALIFARLFFPAENAAVGLVASFATFGLAYVARPIGAVVLAHLGDKMGRKPVLIITIVGMGFATFIVGLLPTYDQIGVAAPILLVLLRLIQGFSAGAESAGGGALTLEHAPDHQRAFFSGSVLMGFGAGTSLATVVFIPVALLPDDQLFSWGWRIPFLLSILVTAIGFYMRRRLDETPIFEEIKEEREIKRIPIVEVFRTQPLQVLRVVVITLLAVMQTIFNVFGLAYATGPAVGVDRTSMLVINTVVLALSLISIPLVARISDRIGRKPVLLTGAIGCAVSVFFYFWCISTGEVWLIFIGAFVNITLFFSCYSGLYLAFFGEMFKAPVRFTGVAVGQQISLILTGFAPLIGNLLLGTGKEGWIPVACFTAVCMLLAAVGVIFSRETYRVPTEDLGNKDAVPVRVASRG